MFDFKDKSDELAELAADTDLIDRWNDMAYLFSHRKNIRFLKSYNFIAVSPQCERLRIHLFEGHVYPSGNVGGWHHIYGTNDQNSFGRIDNLVNNSDPLGYFSAHISIKDSSGNFIPKKDTNGTLIENDMFRRDWTKEELLENISLAFTNKTYTGVGNKFEGQMSDGKTITICVNGNTSVIDNTTNIKTVWPNR